jgi:hypothetical protein
MTRGTTPRGMSTLRMCVLCFLLSNAVFLADSFLQCYDENYDAVEELVTVERSDKSDDDSEE